MEPLTPPRFWNADITRISNELVECEDEVEVHIKQNLSFKQEISNLKYDLSLEVVKRERLEIKVAALKQESSSKDTLLKLYDLCALCLTFTSQFLLFRA